MMSAFGAEFNIVDVPHWLQPYCYITERISLLNSQKQELLCSHDCFQGISNMIQEIDLLSNHVKSGIRDELHLQDKIILYEEHNRSLQNIRAEIDLWQEEFEYYEKNENPKIFARLIVESDPFPKVVKYRIAVSRNSEETPLVVRLLLAPRSRLLPFSGSVTAQIHYEGSGKHIPMENYTKTLGGDGIVDFSDLRFTKPSHKSAVYLTFHADFQIGNENQKLQSPSTHKFIVTCHENQWQDSAGKLLYRSLFLKYSEISKIEFLNKLQVAYLKATRQPRGKIVRSLTVRELEYIFKVAMKIENAKEFKSCNFSQFWSWYGAVLQKIRHHEFLKSMWLSGQLYGFVSKTDAEKLLCDYVDNTFLFRFSETMHGSLAIAVKLQQGVAHCVFKSEELKRLPVHIERYHSLQNLVTANALEPFCITEEPPKQQTISKSEFLQSFSSSSFLPQQIRPGYSTLSTLVHQH